ncbi:hypothetical protein R1sor_019415 [Riccia sorocarpa]|uniref:Uncharacterized protein n=1 Tax=Riccia sorocarpa TaxID=122646 RepID=A0ABD3ICG7_9MARC
MVLGLTKDGYLQLTKACRKFIWGVNKEGAEKKSMIAWKKICRKREEGGLGIVNFDLHAKSLKMRLMTKVLTGEDLDWVHLFRAIITWKVLDTQARKNEISEPVEEILLTGNRLRLQDTPVMARILDGWWDARKYLKFKETARVPREVNLEFAVKALLGRESFSVKDGKENLSKLKKIGVLKLQDISEDKLLELQAVDANGGRKVQGTRPCGPTSRATEVLLTRLQQLGPEGAGLNNPGLWEWRREGKVWEGWDQKTQIWRQILRDKTETGDKLNHHWAVSWDTERWKRWWSSLWKAEAFLRDKMWIWKVLLGGLCVNDRLKKMGFGDAIKLDDVRLTYLLLWVAHTKRAWKDRCRLHFEGKSAMTPIKVIIQDAVESGKELAAGQVSHTKRKASEMAVAYLNLMAQQVNKEWRASSFDHKRLVQGPLSHSAATQSREESPHPQE